MTYRQFLTFGYVSQLSCLACGGGPSGSTIATENAIASQQLNTAATSNANAAADRANSLALEQPLISKETAIASGDRTAALSAAMPTISTISGGYDAARQSIFNTLPAGAARDKAIAGLETQKATGIAGAQAQQVEAAPGVLANIGSGQGAFSLQELGAALSGFSGSSSSTQATAGMQMQQSQAKWQPIIGLAQAAGGAAGGIFEGKG